MERTSKKKIQRPSTRLSAKRVTAHKKATPLKAIENHRRGPVKVEYVEDAKKRANTLCDRRKGLYKQGKDLSVLTGADVTITVNGREWNSKFPDGRPPAPTEAEKRQYVMEPTLGYSGSSSSTVPLDTDMLSPRMLKRRRITADTKDQEAQCSVLGGPVIPIGTHGSDRQCRVCVGLYSVDSSKHQSLWIGCDQEACGYWIQSKCMLGEGPDRRILNKIPFVCPLCRK